MSAHPTGPTPDPHVALDGLAYRAPADHAAARAFFAGKPDAAAVFAAAVSAITGAGTFLVVATKSRVALLARTRFAWCGQANQDGTVYLRFFLPWPLDHPRLRRDDWGGRCSHRVTLRRLEDVDDQVVAWLAAALRADRDET